MQVSEVTRFCKPRKLPVGFVSSWSTDWYRSSSKAESIHVFLEYVNRGLCRARVIYRR